MDDAQNSHEGEVQETSVQPVAESVSAGPPPKLFTQDDVNRIVAERLSRDRKDRSGNGKASTASEPVSSGTEPPSWAKELFGNLTQKMQSLETELAATKTATKRSHFNSAYNKLGLPETAKDLAHAAFEAAGADKDPAEFLAGMREAFGLSVMPPVKSASDNGAPSGNGDAAGINALRLSKGDIARLQEQGRFREVIEKYRQSLPGGAGSIFGPKLTQKRT